MSTRTIRIGIAAAATSVALLVPVGTASAHTRTNAYSAQNDGGNGDDSASAARVGVAKRRCLAGIDARLRTIDRLERAAGSNRTLTDAHQATIDAFLHAARDGLSALKPQVQAATDKATLTTLCKSVVTDYRIYVLRVPQVRLAIGFDASDAAAVQLTHRADRLQQAIDKAKAAGKNTSAAEAKLAEMRAAIDAAKAATAGQADALLKLTPADYNANNGVLGPYRSSLATAHTQLKTAVADGRAVLQILKSL